MSLIDNFASLVRKHHKTMDDFQLLGTSLMASSKIYGLRVDSVHTEVVNMSNVLSRREGNIIKIFASNIQIIFKFINIFLFCFYKNILFVFSYEIAVEKCPKSG